MSDAWFDNGVITARAIGVCERARMLRAVRVAEETIEIAGGVACRRSDGKWPNAAGGGIGIERALTHDDVDRLVAWYDAIGKDARVEIGDRAGIEAFTLLGAAGFRLKDLVSILTLEMPRETSGGAEPEGVSFVELTPANPARCRALAEVLTEAFMPPGTPASPEDVAANLAGIVHPEAIVLGAFVGDRCAGGGFLDIAEGAASLWGAAVAPEFRRRGIQRALMERRLAMACRRGATLAYIETSPGGPTHRNAARLGFRLAYTRALMTRPRG